MFIVPSIDLSMKLSLSEVFVSNIIVTMVISNKSCCKHVLFTNLSDFISTTTRVTSLKSKKFLFCSFSVAKFGIAPQNDLEGKCFSDHLNTILQKKKVTARQRRRRVVRNSTMSRWWYW